MLRRSLLDCYQDGLTVLFSHINGLDCFVSEDKKGM